MALPTLRSGQDQQLALHTCVAALHCAGYPVEWSRWYSGGALVDPPVTTRERSRHMINLHGESPATVGMGRDRSPESGRGSSPESRVTFDDILAELKAVAPGPGRQLLLERHVTAQLQALLQLRSRHIDPHTEFSNLGLDSLRALELRGRLQSALQIPIPVAALWSHPTIHSFSTHLEDVLGLGVRPEQKEA